MATIRAQLMKASTGMMAEENLRLQTERERLEREIAGLSARTPEQAKRLVEEADKILEKRDDEFAELRKRRDAIDAQFAVTARAQREAQQRAWREAQQAAVNNILASEERRLAAIEAAETSLRNCMVSIQAARAAAKEICDATKDLSGGQWSTHADLDFLNRISALMARSMIENFGPRFGQYVNFRAPPESLRSNASGSPKPDWRMREEKAMERAIAQVMGELP